MTITTFCKSVSCSVLYTCIHTLYCTHINSNDLLWVWALLFPMDTTKLLVNVKSIYSQAVCLY